YFYNRRTQAKWHRVTQGQIRKRIKRCFRGANPWLILWEIDIEASYGRIIEPPSDHLHQITKPHWKAQQAPLALGLVVPFSSVDREVAGGLDDRKPKPCHTASCLLYSPGKGLHLVRT